MPIVFGYWNLRGLAGQIRMLLHYSGQEWVNQEYKIGDAPDFSREDWFSKKFTLGLDFPNLPYLIDGDVKLTQSIAILRYLARKFDLYPTEPELQTRADLLEQEFFDYRIAITRVVYNPSVDEKTFAELLKNLEVRVKALSKFFGNGPWALGSKFSYIDFILYDILKLLEELETDLVKPHANLVNFTEQFAALPKIASFFSDPAYYEETLFGPMAKFAKKNRTK